MNNPELTMQYAEWAIIIILSIFFFSLFSKKHKDFMRLFPLVIIPVWIIIAIIKGIEYINFHNTYMLASVSGFVGLLAETLPMILAFGCTTFYFKYRKLKKPAEIKE